MSYIVIELQKDALSKDMNVTNLLRKALVVAKKLTIADFENWINLELNGYYNTKTEIPSYRQISGQIKAYNPYAGWIPTIFDGDSEIQELLSKNKIADPITQLEYLLKEESKQLVIPFNAKIEKSLGEMFDFDTKYQLFFDKSQLQKIIETVKTIILEWSLKLEIDGILGEEMIFSKDEKEIAHDKNYTVNNFYGNVINSSIQQNTKKSRQG